MGETPEASVGQDTTPSVERQDAYSVGRELRVLRAMRPRQIASLLSRAYTDWSDDGAARLGAALAYFTLFSVAPVLVVVTGVAGLFIGQAAAKGQISPWLERFLSPDGAQAAELMLQQAATPVGGMITTLSGVLTLVLGTSALVSEIRQSLNVVWRVRDSPSQSAGILASLRSMASDRMYAFLIVVGAGLLVL